MKNLDTHTVLEIIKMIDTQIKYLDCRIQSLPLKSLKKHLQSYVESQLEIAENQTEQ